MAYFVQQFVKNSLLLSLTILVCWLHVTAARAVQLKRTEPTVKRDSMPDELHVTLTGETGTFSDVQLRLLQHSVPEWAPVYTLEVDESGQYVQHLEELEVNNNVAYYHDLNNNAVMQVTRTAGRGDREAYFELQGDLTIDGHRYSLNPNKGFQPKPSSPSKAESYTLVAHEPPRFAGHDHIPASLQVRLQVVEAEHAISPDLSNIFALEKVQRRHFHRSNEVAVNVKAVIDYPGFRRFRDISHSRKEAIKAIRQWYAFIFYFMDWMYRIRTKDQKYTIHVRLIKIVICKTAATSNFTQHSKLPNLKQTIMVKVLEAFRDFTKGTGTVFNPNDDHAMLFSGYDLVKVEANGNVLKSPRGIAYISTICSKQYTSVSVIEESGVYHEVINVAAHELAHSLGASHDDDVNYCNETDTFLMGAVTDITKSKTWKFSNCSFTSIMNYIKETLKSSAGAKCLLRLKPVRKVPDVSHLLPGLEYSANEQCRMIQGKGSRMCPYWGRYPSRVCTHMRCYNPSDGTCYEYTAARGTPCGNKEI